jgi:NADH-quinone oxidoreductase subunit H
LENLSIILLRIISLAVFIVLILLGIAFFTLFERKILRYSQNRLGPNKVAGLGLLQPAMDGIKLLLKECIFPFQTFPLGFLIFPSLVFPIILCA